MNFKLAWILFAVLLFAVGGLLVTVLLDNTPDAGEILLQPLAGVTPDDIDTVELVRSEPTEGKIVLTRTDKTHWDVTEPGRGRADAFVVRKIIADLLAVKPTPSKDVTDNKTVHGLDKPGLSVTLKAGTKAATLNIGDTTLGRNAITFVTTGTRPNTPVAVLRGDIDGLFRPDTGSKDDKAGKSWEKARWLADYRQRAFFKGEIDLMAEAESVALSKAGHETKLVRNPGTGEWTFATPAGYGVADLEGDPKAPPATFTGVRPLVNALTALQVAAADDFIEKPGPLAQYGLDPADKDVLRLEVKPTSGPADVLLVGKRVDDKTDKFYCKLASDTVVAKASAVPERVAALAAVATDPSALRDRTLVPSTKQFAIDAIDLTVGPSVAHLRRVPTPADSKWLLYGGPNDPQLAAVTVQTLLTTLTQPRGAKEVLTAPYDAVFAGAEKKAEIKLWYDGLEKPAPEKDPAKMPPEPKLKGDGKPSVTIIVGKKEGDIVYVRRITADGIRTDMKFPEAALPTLTRDRLGYVDGGLKPFPTNTVKKLTIVRGGETFTVESDGKAHADQWKYLSPDRLKGQTADAGKVMECVGRLPIMNATRVVAEAPADADLAKYGLGANPRIKVVVGFDTPAEPDRTFEFGNEAEDKNFVYLRTNARPLVVTVSNQFFVLLQNDDFRDRLLYQIDPAKVKAIELTGWKQALKQPTKYRFERTAGGWVVKEPAGEKGTIDPAKMEIFLATLTAPRAVNYVPGGFKPEQGFDLTNAVNTLEIKFQIEGHPDLAVTLANEYDGGAMYFGWTITKKGDVFTIPATGLKEFKEKPQAFFK
ncbi:DUF4340 domain-containing protein [Limnoglobus roseus]|uniref:DUF4340 domain-containing protein n=1 Tax=Limnoglobus roseus TaxID=2598579 RepID=A0A5C1A8H2_9BACT|nr:DUF4340 domain-containing protein [Limnoglobus roseus]QEL15521.1 hypothetical protein PX52LOC_02445 [Limnoglobus roseus]